MGSRMPLKATLPSPRGRLSPQLQQGHRPRTQKREQLLLLRFLEYSEPIGSALFLRNGPPTLRNPLRALHLGVDMRKLVCAFLLGMTALSSPVVATAQEAAVTAGTEVPRVVIAPPRTELARIIKSGLAASYQSTAPESRAYNE